MLQRTSIPQLDSRSSAAQFLAEHDHLTNENAKLTEHNASLLAQNAALLSENNMLRDELARSDKDRVTLQGFAAGLATRLAVIQETISVALADAAAYKIKPEEKKVEETIPQARFYVAVAPETKTETASPIVMQESTSASSRLPLNSLMT